MGTILHKKFPSEEESGQFVPEFKGHHTPLKTLRHCDQKKDSDGAVHWNSRQSQLQQDRLQAIDGGSNKTRFDNCTNFKNLVIHARAMQTARPKSKVTVKSRWKI